MINFFGFGRSITSSLASAVTVTSVTSISSVTASSAESSATTAAASSFSTFFAFCSFSFDCFGADSSGLGLDLWLGDAEFGLDIGDAVVVKSIVIMSPSYSTS